MYQVINQLIDALNNIIKAAEVSASSSGSGNIINNIVNQFLSSFDSDSNNDTESLIPGPSGRNGVDGINGIDGKIGPPGIDAEEELPYIIPGPPGIGSATPGGSDTQVQFNDGGVLGGDAGLVYDKTTDTLTTAIITQSDDHIFTADKVIRRNTSDGSDNGQIQITGGGAATGTPGNGGFTRGGCITLHGNEDATLAGEINIDNGGSGNISIEALNGQVTSFSIYNDTTVSVANVEVTSAGRLQRSTSSIKNKTDLKPLANNEWQWIKTIPTQTFQSKLSGDQEKGKFQSHRFIGLIAEDVAIACPMAVSYDKDGQPDSVLYGALTVPIIKMLQDITIRLEKLESKNL